MRAILFKKYIHRDLLPKSPSTASRSLRFASVGIFKAASSFPVSSPLEGSSYKRKVKLINYKWLWHRCKCKEENANNIISELIFNLLGSTHHSQREQRICHKHPSLKSLGWIMWPQSSFLHSSTPSCKCYIVGRSHPNFSSG